MALKQGPSRPQTRFTTHLPGATGFSACLLASTFSVRAAQAQTRYEPSDGRVGRIAVETGVGLGGTLGGGFVGALLGLVTSGTTSCGPQAPMCIPGGFVWGAMLGAVIGQNVGVYASGNAMGANGSYWATLGGQMVGLAGAVGLTLPPGSSQGSRAVLGFSVLPLAGAVTGYELSTHGDSRGSQSTADSSQPLLSVSGQF
jgi:hypothetical protein